MKIKSNLYCITDKNNKPDYRYLFESQADAKRKINQIKNSTKGETLFISQNKRDFFVDGVNRKLIDPYRKITIKRGCWSGLKVKKLSLLDTIQAEQFFKKTVKAEENEFTFSKQSHREIAFQNPTVNFPTIPNPFLSFDWETSVLRTKTFAATLATLCLVTVVSVFLINQNATNTIAKQLLESQNQANSKIVAAQTKILGAKDQRLASKFDEDLNKFVIETLKGFTEVKQEDFENKIHSVLAGSPMEKMVPYISQQDRTVAAFLVGIAKKESNFGRRVPVLNGEDCFNYWGYRGIRDRMGSGGHTCFDSPEDAVNTVAGRISDLVQSDINTPQEMVIWKCGSACNQDSQPAVVKWISDVSIYFNELKEQEKQEEEAEDSTSS